MSEYVKEPKSFPLPRILWQRSFRLLWSGEGISILGDQFYFIALPWLVFKMNGDALAVGCVLAAATIPRALFMLFGGAITDRFSPRTVMLTSNLMRMVVVALLTVLVFAGLINLLVLYILSLIFGFVDAFFYPVQSSIVPQLVEKEDLQIGNSIIHGTAQLSRFAGPILAGVLITLLGGWNASLTAGADQPPDLMGLGTLLDLTR